MNLMPISRKNRGLGFVYAFLVAALFTSSFDIFLVLNLGFNFRITQILLLIPIGLAVANIVQKKRAIWPLGFGWLLLWTMIIITFVPNTYFLARSIGYALWLLFNVFAIFAFVQFISTPSKAVGLVRWYVYSFVFVAVFGLIQFVSPLAGLGNNLLITQWWFYGILPRVNGFSYEPSYFATYLLMGWVVCAYLLQSKSTLFTRTHLQFYFLTISLALVLSTSRMGILMMLIWYIQYPLQLLVRLGLGHFNKRFFRITIIVLGVMLFLILLVIFVIGLDKLLFLFSGLGIFDTSSHSISERKVRMMDTLSLFINSPVIGYSLGGIGPAIAHLHGVTNIDFVAVKTYEGMCIFLEVLAASGLFGFIPFAIFIFLMVSRPLRLARKVLSEQSKILVALTLALIFELVILQFNQNILRPYLWLHLAVLAASYSVFKRRYKSIERAGTEALILATEHD